MNRSKLYLSAASMLAALSGQAMAGDFYIGAGAGISSLEPHEGTTGGYVIEGNDTAKRGMVGYNFDNRFGVEGYYADLGEAEVAVSGYYNPKYPTQDQVGHIGYKVAGVHGVYHVHSTDGYGIKGKSGASLFVKGGVNKMSNTAHNVNIERLHDYSFTAGIGAEYKSARGLGVRIDGDVYDKDAAAAYISATAHFGGAAMPMMALPEEMYSDIDGDGIEDSADQCVTEPGSAANYGCPVPVAPQPMPDLCGPSRALGTIYFGMDSARLDNAAFRALDNLAQYMQNCPSARLDLGGNTCAGASEQHNRVLSRRRAEAVASYLSARGVSPRQMRVNWYGESRPAVPNNSPRNMQLNRRVEISVINSPMANQYRD